MINPNAPAFPNIDWNQAHETGQYYQTAGELGMNIRTKIAAIAMQGILSNKPPRTALQYDGYSPELVAAAAIAYADALIKELNKEG